MSCNFERFKGRVHFTSIQYFWAGVSTHFDCIPLIVQLYVNCMLTFATVHLFVNQFGLLYVMKFDFAHSGFITLYYWT